MIEKSWHADPPGVTVHSAVTREHVSPWQRWPAFARWDTVTDAAMRANPDFRVDLALAACALMLGLFSFGTLIAIGYLNYTKLPWFDAWTHWIRYLNSGSSL